TDALHTQAEINALNHKLFRQREEMDPLFYEVIHNLVVECTRLGVEVHNLKMRLESLSSRLDFDERRGRSLESVVQYRRPGRRQHRSGRRASTSATVSGGPQPGSPQAPNPTEPAGDSPKPQAEGAGASPGAPPRPQGEGSPRPFGEGGQRPEGREGGRRRR